MDLIEEFALTALEETMGSKMKGIPEEHYGFAVEAAVLGVRVACLALGETETYHEEMERIVAKLKGMEAERRGNQ
jgi:hypothetical protein